MATINEVERAGDLIAARHAAIEFLERNLLVPNEDAIGQLTDVFVPCLKIICERGYVNPETGRALWQEAGWRAVATDIRKKADRLWRKVWKQGKFDEDSGIDLINFCGFYLRGHKEDPQNEWGDWGEPG